MFHLSIKTDKYFKMKKDIMSRADIEKVVRLFYDKVKADEIISFFFCDVVEVNWEKHHILMCDFWENVLFYTGDYQGNPMDTHKRINALHRTESVHFQKWEELFYSSVDSLYKGKNAEKMKQHAKAIVEVMLNKL